MDNMSLDAFVFPGWGNPPRLIGDLAQAGNTPLGAHFSTLHASCLAHVHCKPIEGLVNF